MSLEWLKKAAARCAIALAIWEETGLTSCLTMEMAYAQHCELRRLPLTATLSQRQAYYGSEGLLNSAPYLLHAASGKTSRRSRRVSPLPAFSKQPWGINYPGTE